MNETHSANSNALLSVMIAEPSEDIIQPKLCRHAHFLDSGSESDNSVSLLSYKL